MAKSSSKPAAGAPVAGLSDERRRGSRKSVIDVELVTVDLGEHRGALLLDLSETGIGVQTLSGAELGTSTPVSFELPESRVRIQAKGSIAWFDSSGRAGVHFVDLAHRDREHVREWLSHGSTGIVAEEPPISLTGIPAIDPAAEIELLESEIVSNKLPTDTALALVVQRTSDLTRAMGAAIALDDGSGMMCRATIGVAPHLGVRLQPDSGLSGECVRSGEIVRCEDTETDPRADRVLCRRINLRSVVILPVKAGSLVVGLLEVFSSLPHAFDSADIILLRHIVSLIAALTEAESRERQLPGSAPAPKPAPEAAAKVATQSFSAPAAAAAPAPAIEKPKPALLEVKPDLSATRSYDAGALGALLEKTAVPTPATTPQPAAKIEPVKAASPKVEAKAEPKPETKTTPKPLPLPEKTTAPVAAAPQLAKPEKKEEKKPASVSPIKPVQSKPEPAKKAEAKVAALSPKPTEKSKVAEIPVKPPEKPSVQVQVKGQPASAKPAAMPAATTASAAAAAAPARAPEELASAAPKPVIGSGALVCDSCGYSNPKTALVCERCDIPLTMSYSPVTGETERKLIVPPSFSGATETNRATPARIAVAALVLAAIGGGTWATLHYKSASPAAKPAVTASAAPSSSAAVQPVSTPAPPLASVEPSSSGKSPAKSSKTVAEPERPKPSAANTAAAPAGQPVAAPEPPATAIEIAPPVASARDARTDAAPPPVVALNSASSPLTALPPGTVAVPARADASPTAYAGITGGKLLRRVEPLYPAMARSLGLHGAVSLRAVISKTGDVKSVQMVSGSPILASSAISAVKRWKYEPFKLNGEPVERETDIQVNFTLTR